MKKVLLVISLWIIVVANCSCVGVSVSVMPYCMNWNMLVAYDEEMASTSFVFYAPFPGGIFPVSTVEYMRIQFERVALRFQKEFAIQYYVVDYVQFESDDSLETTADILVDAMEKVGFSSGMSIGDVKVYGLIVWTMQYVEDYFTITGSGKYGGAALPNDQAVIVHAHPNDPWADDNILQHELSHLHGCALTDHYTENHCVMDQNREHVEWYNEPLEPVSSGHALLYLGVYETLIGGYIHNEWCAECKEMIKTHTNFWYYDYSVSQTEDMDLPSPSPIGVLKVIAMILAFSAFPFLLGYGISRVIKHFQKKRREKK